MDEIRWMLETTWNWMNELLIWSLENAGKQKKVISTLFEKKDNYRDILGTSSLINEYGSIQKNVRKQ